MYNSIFASDFAIRVMSVFPSLDIEDRQSDESAVPDDVQLAETSEEDVCLVPGVSPSLRMSVSASINRPASNGVPSMSVGNIG